MMDDTPKDFNGDDMQAGDIIRFDSGAYSHYAIYAGNLLVYHVTGSINEEDTMKNQLLKAFEGNVDSKVKKERISFVANSRKYFIDNMLDQTVTPREVEEILGDADAFVGKQWEFKLALNNCEHFVTWMRYGEVHKCSQQVEGAVKKAIGSIPYRTLKATVKKSSNVARCGSMLILGSLKCGRDIDSISN